jgi:hypothetical protein
MKNKSEDFNLKSLSIRRIEMQVLKAIIISLVKQNLLEELNLILFLKTLGIGGISELVLKANIINEKYI